MAIRMNADGTFPTRAYHPIHGGRDVQDANDIAKLGPDWFNTAEEADKARTWTEAKVVMHHNQSVKMHESLGTEMPNANPAPGPATEPAGVVRNSVAATESLNSGANEPL